MGARRIRYRARDSGAVTVEAALALCSVVAVFALALGGMGVLIVQLRCTDAAIEAARLVARGEQGRATEAVRQIAPTGARLYVDVRGDEITATVTARPLAGLLPGHGLSSSAFAVMEPGQATEREPGAEPAEEVSR